MEVMVGVCCWGWDILGLGLGLGLGLVLVGWGGCEGWWWLIGGGRDSWLGVASGLFSLWLLLTERVGLSWSADESERRNEGQ